MLTKVFPFLKWFQGYECSGSLRTDMIAGLTVALVLIPQSMAYAQLAGLPPYYGLYAAFLPPMLGSPVRIEPPVGHRPRGGGLPHDVCITGPAGHRRQ